MAYRQVIKRILDTIAAFFGLCILSWLIILVAIAIKLTSKGPVLFKQRRIGINKKEFDILKFRTMKHNTPQDVPTHLMQNPDTHTTPIGKILRKTSIDELPQLLSVLKGDMSIIGPRPALWNQYDLIKERDKYGANDVLPGLTGLAQINGRDEISIQKKAQLDGEYTKSISLGLDVKIFFASILTVIKMDGFHEGPKCAKTDVTVE